MKNRFKKGVSGTSPLTILNNLKLHFLLDEEKYMSNRVTSVFLSKNISVNDFVGKMYENGYILYLGKSPLLKENMFQIANMGNINSEDCTNKMCNVLQNVLKKMFNYSVRNY